MSIWTTKTYGNKWPCKSYHCWAWWYMFVIIQVRDKVKKIPCLRPAWATWCVWDQHTGWGYLVRPCVNKTTKCQKTIRDQTPEEGVHQSSFLFWEPSHSPSQRLQKPYSCNINLPDWSNGPGMTSPTGSIRLIPGNLKLHDVLYDFLCKGDENTSNCRFVQWSSKEFQLQGGKRWSKSVGGNRVKEAERHLGFPIDSVFYWSLSVGQFSPSLRSWDIYLICNSSFGILQAFVT